MLKNTYFNCKNKGRVLVLYFKDPDEITVSNLIGFLDCEADRYIKLIVESEGEKVSLNMLKHELDNKDIIEFSRNWLKKDLTDYAEIKKQLN